ncbi:MAG: phage polymerase-related protein [Verrucomicrobia bacterium]|nr:phage polymerase-related protein [Verrucomicrobiota bacterium]
MPASPIAAPDAAALAKLDLDRVRALSKRCVACPLYQLGTQTVFGEGPRGARILIVGEQPGDREDLAGRPFVGPAGRLLDEALVEAGIDRGEVYVTNAVKHFKWKPEGKRRLHQKPNAREIAACRPWLDAEMALVAPDIVVALGATAAQALMGAAFRVTKDRGRQFHPPWTRTFVATVHPSSILRAPPDRRDAERRAFVADLKRVAALGKVTGKCAPGKSR